MSILDRISVQMQAPLNVLDIRQDEHDILLLNAAINGSIDDMSLNEALRAADFMLSLSNEQLQDEFLPFERNALSAGLESGFFKSVGSGIMRVVDAIVEGLKKLFRRIGEFLGFKTKNIASKKESVNTTEDALDAALDELKEVVDRMAVREEKNFAAHVREQLDKQKAKQKARQEVKVDVDDSGKPASVVVEVEVPKDAKPAAPIIQEKEKSVVIEVPVEKAEEIVASVSKNKEFVIDKTTLEAIKDIMATDSFEGFDEMINLICSDEATLTELAGKAGDDKEKTITIFGVFFTELMAGFNMIPPDSVDKLKNGNVNFVRLLSDLKNEAAHKRTMPEAITLSFEDAVKQTDAVDITKLKNAEKAITALANKLKKPDVSYITTAKVTDHQRNLWNSYVTSACSYTAAGINVMLQETVAAIQFIDEVVTYQLKILNSVKPVVTNKPASQRKRGKK